MRSNVWSSLPMPAIPPFPCIDSISGCVFGLICVKKARSKLLTETIWLAGKRGFRIRIEPKICKFDFRRPCCFRFVKAVLRYCWNVIVIMSLGCPGDVEGAGWDAGCVDCDLTLMMIWFL